MFNNSTLNNKYEERLAQKYLYRNILWKFELNPGCNFSVKAHNFYIIKIIVSTVESLFDKIKVIEYIIIKFTKLNQLTWNSQNSWQNR